MTQNRVFLSYNDKDAVNRDFVETLARQLQGDARLSFWFAPWHSIPGVPVQEQMEDALWDAQSYAVFVSGSDQIEGWQNEQMRTALNRQVSESEGRFGVIPVLLPGTPDPRERPLPRFLVGVTWVDFRSGLDDGDAFH